MAPVRKLRSFAWMNARKFPGVRCSTLNTECRSLLCLIIMPGRSWVAGIAIAAEISFKIQFLLGGSGQTTFSARVRQLFSLHVLGPVGKPRSHRGALFSQNFACSSLRTL